MCSPLMLLVKGLVTLDQREPTQLLCFVLGHSFLRIIIIIIIIINVTPQVAYLQWSGRPCDAAAAVPV